MTKDRVKRIEHLVDRFLNVLFNRDSGAERAAILLGGKHDRYDLAPRMRIVLRHALPNALGPIVNAVALSLSYLVGGVIIVETIFNYPGIAKLMVDGVATRDLPLIQSCAMIFCLGYLILITLADIVAILSNPRLR